MEDTLKQDLKTAMLAHNEVAVATIRLVLSELKYTHIEKGDNLQDTDVIAVVQKEVKKRKEAAAGFRKGGREESAEKEEAELKVLEGYLPEQMSDEELTNIVENSINELGATGMADMGKVISAVMAKAGQSVEGARVSSLVREKLSK